MNKFSSIANASTLKEDYAFIKQLESKNSELEKEIWLKFCSKTVEEQTAKPALFKQHPRRISSDSELSELAESTPRHLNLCDDFNLKGLARDDMTTNLAADDLTISNLLMDDLVSNDYTHNNPMSNHDVLVGDIPNKQLRSKFTKLYDLDSKNRSIDLGGGGDKNKPPLTDTSKINIKKKSKSAIKQVSSTCMNGVKDMKNTKERMKSCKARINVNKHTKKESTPNTQRSDLSVGAFSIKLKNVIQKCLIHIGDIRLLLETGVDSYDGDEDFSRRMKRVQEFSSRFSRTYLYPLGRQVEEFYGMTPESPNLNQKIVGAFHTIQQALQAYNTHLPSSAGNCVSDKVESLLKHALNVCNSYNYLIGDNCNDDQNEYIEAFKHHIRVLSEDIKYNFQSSMKSAAKENRKPQNKNINKKAIAFQSKKKYKQCSWMTIYNSTASFRKDPNWKTTVDYMTRKKYNVKSRYKTASYKHRQLTKNSEIGSEKLVFPVKSSATCIKNTPLVTPIKEDEIETMVQVEQRRDIHVNEENKQTVEEKCVQISEGRQKSSREKQEHSEDNQKSSEKKQSALEDQQKSSEQKFPEDKQKTWNEELQNTTDKVANQECVTAKLVRLLRDKCKVAVDQSGNVDDRSTIEFLKSTLANPTECNREILSSILEELETSENNSNDNSDRKKTLFEAVKSSLNLDCQSTQKKKKEPKITVTGVKNAKLYCIQDENSVSYDDEFPLEEEPRAPSEVLLPMKNFFSSETQTDIQGEERVDKSTQKSSKASVKISRLPKIQRQKLQLLESSKAVNIIQYKLDFKRYSKQNPMYDKSSALQPWVLMGRISDRLLDDALMLVAREIEMDGLLENIYMAEFQY